MSWSKLWCQFIRITQYLIGAYAPIILGGFGSGGGIVEPDVASRTAAIERLVERHAHLDICARLEGLLEGIVGRNKFVIAP